MQTSITARLPIRLVADRPQAAIMDPSAGAEAWAPPSTTRVLGLQTWTLWFGELVEGEDRLHGRVEVAGGAGSADRRHDREPGETGGLSARSAFGVGDVRRPRVTDLRPGVERGNVIPVRATPRLQASLLLSRRGGA